jgi:hypothetical protein
MWCAGELKISLRAPLGIKKYWKNAIIVVILHTFFTGNQEEKGTETVYVEFLPKALFNS